jgi:two-component system sensor histidine kinase PhoQ
MTRPGALTTRVLVSATLLLTLFFGLTFAALDLGFRRAAERALEDLLESQVLGLLTAADPATEGVIALPDSLPETRFSRPGSGLYALVTETAGETVWVSPSALGLRLPAPAPETPGRIGFKRLTLGDGDDLLNASLRVEWEFEDGSIRDFVFSVASSLDGYRDQVSRYRTRLGGWLVLLTVLLVLAQFMVLRFILRPLGQAEQEVREIEAGQRQRLSAGYPDELDALAGSVNTLIEGERARSQRYRESLDNLAHSLKTPLAVVRSQLEMDEADPSSLLEQVERMRGIVDYQLRRAATGAETLSRGRVPVAPVADATLQALRKVYADKQPELESIVDPSAEFVGDRGDLAEILGNLLDNGCKYCVSKVRLRIAAVPDTDNRHAGLEITVEDDGPGISLGDADRLVRRGARGDEVVPGQGIGLAVVRDIAEARGGELCIGPSGLGGTRVEIRLPPS